MICWREKLWTYTIRHRPVCVTLNLNHSRVDSFLSTRSRNYNREPAANRNATTSVSQPLYQVANVCRFLEPSHTLRHSRSRSDQLLIIGPDFIVSCAPQYSHHGEPQHHHRKQPTSQSGDILGAQRIHARKAATKSAALRPYSDSRPED